MKHYQCILCFYLIYIFFASNLVLANENEGINQCSSNLMTDQQLIDALPTQLKDFVLKHKNRFIQRKSKFQKLQNFITNMNAAYQYCQSNGFQVDRTISFDNSRHENYGYLKMAFDSNNFDTLKIIVKEVSIYTHNFGESDGTGGYLLADIFLSLFEWIESKRLENPNIKHIEIKGEFVLNNTLIGLLKKLGFKRKWGDMHKEKKKECIRVIKLTLIMAGVTLFLSNSISSDIASNVTLGAGGLISLLPLKGCLEEIGSNFSLQLDID